MNMQVENVTSERILTSRNTYRKGSREREPQETEIVIPIQSRGFGGGRQAAGVLGPHSALGRHLTDRVAPGSR